MIPGGQRDTTESIGKARKGLIHNDIDAINSQSATFITTESKCVDSGCVDLEIPCGSHRIKITSTTWNDIIDFPVATNTKRLIRKVCLAERCRGRSGGNCTGDHLIGCPKIDMRPAVDHHAVAVVTTNNISFFCIRGSIGIGTDLQIRNMICS